MISYDGAGNIKSQTLGANYLGYTYDSRNRLASTSGSKPASYSYDTQGNISSDTGALTPSGALGTSTYAYDGANNLRYVNKGSASQAEYAYDGLNQRVWTNKLPSPSSGTGTAVPNPTVALKTYEIYSSNGQLLTEYTPSLAGKVDEHIYLGTKRIGLASRSTTNTPAYSCPVGQSLIGSGAASQCIQTLTTAIKGCSAYAYPAQGWLKRWC